MIHILWQHLKCPLSNLCNCGSSSRQRSVVIGHREKNQHPTGKPIGLVTSPLRLILLLLRVNFESRIGIVDNNALVYGYIVWAYNSSLEHTSTNFPRYITPILSKMFTHRQIMSDKEIRQTHLILEKKHFRTPKCPKNTQQNTIFEVSSILLVFVWCLKLLNDS